MLAQLRAALYKIGVVPRHIKQARVDSLTLQPGRKLTPEVLAYKPTYASGAPVWKAEMLPRDSPTLITTDPESFCPTVEGRAPQPQGWVDLDERAAREWVLQGRSLMIAGLPGTGKSHLLQEWLWEMTGRTI